jgi:hypothetical protein
MEGDGEGVRDGEGEGIGVGMGVAAITGVVGAMFSGVAEQPIRVAATMIMAKKIKIFPKNWFLYCIFKNSLLGSISIDTLTCKAGLCQSWVEMLTAERNRLKRV